MQDDGDALAFGKRANCAPHIRMRRRRDGIVLAEKEPVLKVAAGKEYPGFSRAGGSLLCAHLLEMTAFAVLGAAAALFLPVPGWARVTLLVPIPSLKGSRERLGRDIGCKVKISAHANEHRHQPSVL